MAYSKVDRRTFTDRKFKSLSSNVPNPRLLWMYLLSGNRCTIIPGLLSVGPGGIAEDLGWPVEAVKQFLDELQEAGKTDKEPGMIKYDAAAPLVWLPRAIHYNMPDNPSIVLGWKAVWCQMPECSLLDEAEGNFRAILEAEDTAKGKDDSGLVAALDVALSYRDIGATKLAIGRPRSSQGSPRSKGVGQKRGVHPGVRHGAEHQEQEQGQQQDQDQEQDPVAKDLKPTCVLDPREPEAERGNVPPVPASSDPCPATTPSARVLHEVTATGLVPTQSVSPAAASGSELPPNSARRPGPFAVPPTVTLSAEDIARRSGVSLASVQNFLAQDLRRRPEPNLAPTPNTPAPEQDQPQDASSVSDPSSAAADLRLALDAAVAAGIEAAKHPDRALGIAAYKVAKIRLTEWCFEHGVGPEHTKDALAALHSRVSAEAAPAVSGRAPTSEPGPPPRGQSDVTNEFAARLWAHKVVRVAATKSAAGQRPAVLSLADHVSGLRTSSGKPVAAYTAAIDRACSALSAESAGSAPPVWRAVCQRIDQFCFHARVPQADVIAPSLERELCEAYQAGIRDADPAGLWSMPTGVYDTMASISRLGDGPQWLRNKAAEFRRAKNTTDDAKYTNNWHPRHFITWLNGTSATLVQSQSATHAVQPIDPEQEKKYQDF